MNSSKPHINSFCHKIVANLRWVCKIYIFTYFMLWTSSADLPKIKHDFNTCNIIQQKTLKTEMFFTLQNGQFKQESFSFRKYDVP